MPSFLSKVFGRKKDEKGSPRRVSDGSLLDGKFEAISPIVSPSVTEFPENANGRGNGRVKEGEKDRPFSLFRVKSAPSSPEKPSRTEDLPQLALLLPVPKDNAQARALGVVFEADPDAQILTDGVIGERKLNPLEALILVRTCSQAITARGLETLGLMHPHWYSASPEVQRRLISLFLHSLNPKSPITTLSPTLSSPTSVFETEVNYTRSLHDIAAVLRWGFRHLELSGNDFGQEESWYKDFCDVEHDSEYPPKAYSEKLPPLVPASHFELVNATLELFSSLAAHAEKNSTSGSKLTRTFGLWLLATRRVEESDDWPRFYARWERAGHMLEHLLLARIRDEALRIRMPTRLLELVAQYPYSRGVTTEDDIFLRPRLSTRQHDALFVRVESEFSSPNDKVKRHPLLFIRDAFGSETTSGDNADCAQLWEKIRKASADENEGSPVGHPGLSRVFTDETIRYLSLIPGDHPLKEAITSPAFSVTQIPQENPSSRRQSSWPGSKTKSLNGASNGHLKPATDPSPLPSSAASPLEPDWMQFSSAGFAGLSPAILPLASTLFGQDMEKTNPPSRKPSGRARMSRSPSANQARKSLEVPRDVTPVPLPAPAPEAEAPKPIPEPPKLVSKSIPVSVVQLDEAFVEFWTDALLDPVSSNWPTFVLCKLKSSTLDLNLGEKRIEYLIIEQVFVPKPQPTPLVQVENTEVATSPEKLSASSPKSSKSERRFFGLFSSARGRSNVPVEKVSATTGKSRKKFSPQAQVSELGEVLKEEDKKPSTTVKLRIPSPKPRMSGDVKRKSVDVSRKSVDAQRKSTEVSKEVVKDLAKGAEEAGQSVPVVAAGETGEKDLTKSDAVLASASDSPEQTALPAVALEEQPPVSEPATAAAPAPEVEQAVQQVEAHVDSEPTPQTSDLVATEEDSISPAVETIKPIISELLVAQPAAEPPIVESTPLPEVSNLPAVEEAPSGSFSEPAKPEAPVAEPVTPTALEHAIAGDLGTEQLPIPAVDTTDATPNGRPVFEALVEEPLPEEPIGEEPIGEEPHVRVSTPAVEEPVVEPPVAVEVSNAEEAVEKPMADELPSGANAVEEAAIEAHLVASIPAEDSTSESPAANEEAPLTEEPVVEESTPVVALTASAQPAEYHTEETGAEEGLGEQPTDHIEEAPSVVAEQETEADEQEAVVVAHETIAAEPEAAIVEPDALIVVRSVTPEEDHVMSQEITIEDKDITGEGGVSLEEEATPENQGSAVAATAEAVPVEEEVTGAESFLTPEPAATHEVEEIAEPLAEQEPTSTEEPVALEDVTTEEHAIIAAAEEAPIAEEVVEAEEEAPISENQDPAVTVEAAPADEEVTETEPSALEATSTEPAVAPEAPVEQTPESIPEASPTEVLPESEQGDGVEEHSHVEAPAIGGAPEDVAADSSTPLSPQTEAVSADQPIEIVGVGAEVVTAPVDALAVDESDLLQESPVPAPAEQAEEHQAEPLHVISSTPRIEPLLVEEDTADQVVTQDPVPIVEVPPTATDDAKHVTILLPQDPAQESAAATTESESIIQPSMVVTASGSTPGPQVALDVAETPAIDDESVHGLTPETANGNGHPATVNDKGAADDESISSATIPESLGIEAESIAPTEIPANDVENSDPESNAALAQTSATEPLHEDPELASATPKDD